MNKQYLTQLVQALLNNKIDEAVAVTKNYYIAKMKEIVEDAEKTQIPPQARKDYARAFQRHFNRHLDKKQAKADAYDDVIRRHGKEIHDQLKAYHSTHLQEQQLILELSKKILRSYHGKALDDVEGKAYNLGATADKASKAFDKATIKLDKRKKNVNRVIDKLTKESIDPVNEIADKTIGGNVVGQDHTHEVVDNQTGKVIGKYRSSRRAHRAADKKDLEHGGVRYHARPIAKKVAEGVVPPTQRTVRDVINGLTRQQCITLINSGGSDVDVDDFDNVTDDTPVDAVAKNHYSLDKDSDQQLRDTILLLYQQNQITKDMIKRVLGE